jgi:hypothetical protein
MPHSAPCRNRTYNLELKKGSAGEPFRAVSEGEAVISGCLDGAERSVLADQHATKVQPTHSRPLRLLRDTLALPCTAVRRGWLLPDDGPDGGRAA